MAKGTLQLLSPPVIYKSDNSNNPLKLGIADAKVNLDSELNGLHVLVEAYLSVIVKANMYYDNTINKLIISLDNQPEYYFDVISAKLDGVTTEAEQMNSLLEIVADQMLQDFAEPIIAKVKVPTFIIF